MRTWYRTQHIMNLQCTFAVTEAPLITAVLRTLESPTGEILHDFKHLKGRAGSFVSGETWHLRLTMKNVQNG